jgi:hypothetical protein
MFLERGASMTATNKIGETPLTIAQAFTQQKMQNFASTGTW